MIKQMYELVSLHRHIKYRTIPTASLHLDCRSKCMTYDFSEDSGNVNSGEKFVTKVKIFSTSSLCYKTFFGGNLDFDKIKKLKKVCSDVWTCTKMLKHFWLFLAKNTLKLFIAVKMAYSCSFSKNIFTKYRFPSKSFITFTTDIVSVFSVLCSNPA